MPETIALKLSRIIQGSRQRVFEAWTRPELIQRWFAPGEMKVSSAQLEVRVGGVFRIAMAGDNGTGKCINSAVVGTYHQIVPNELLVFSWGWPEDPSPETLVTVEFRDTKDGSTEIVLTHENFVDSGTVARHEHGWLGCFDNLGKTLESLSQTYENRMFCHAEIGRVFDAVATCSGLRGWWTTQVSGSADPGGDITLSFDGLDEKIIMHVVQSVRPTSVKWECLIHTDLPEWSGTTVHFELSEVNSHTTQLTLRHIGLTPELHCYKHCQVGWQRFLDSLKRLVEQGVGAPFGSQTGAKAL